MDDGRVAFRVLTVCTGNICRSPAAERLIAQRWGDGTGSLVVVSGGTAAMVGDPIQISMAHLLEQTGAYSGEFAAQALTQELVSDADLVLAMTRRHRAAVASLEPSITPRTFTLREFARLVADGAREFDPSDGRVHSLRRLVAVAAARRGPVPDATLDDIADPYGRELDAYQAAFAEIEHAVDVVARVLHGLPPLQPSTQSEPADDVEAHDRRGWRRRR